MEAGWGLLDEKLVCPLVGLHAVAPKWTTDIKSVSYSNETSSLTCSRSDAGCHIFVDDTLDCQAGNTDSPAITSARWRRFLTPSVSSSYPEERNTDTVNSNGAQEGNSACENTHRLFSFFLSFSPPFSLFLCVLRPLSRLLLFSDCDRKRALKSPWNQTWYFLWNIAVLI